MNNSSLEDHVSLCLLNPMQNRVGFNKKCVNKVKAFTRDIIIFTIVDSTLLKPYLIYDYR